MTEEEYRRRRAEIVDCYAAEIDAHESAGCYGDAENSRRWMRERLRELEGECRR